MSEQLTTLTSNNIPFVFNGSDITIDVKEAGKLYDKKIPFKFEDNLITLIAKSDGKKNNIAKSDDSMTTYKFICSLGELLKKGGKFDVSYTSIFGVTGISIHLVYNQSNCDLDLLDNNLVIFYANRKYTIPIHTSLKELHDHLTTYIDGFVLLIIAGFMHNITPTTFTSFYYCVNAVSIEVTYLGTKQFIFNSEHRKDKYYIELYDAIEELKKDKAF